MASAHLGGHDSSPTFMKRFWLVVHTMQLQVELESVEVWIYADSPLQMRNRRMYGSSSHPAMAQTNAVKSHAAAK